MYGNKVKIAIKNLKFCVLSCSFFFLLFVFYLSCFAQDIKQPNAAGTFYPDNPQELSRFIDTFLKNANPEVPEGAAFCLICPHAGYGYSGQTAAFGYKLIKDKTYKTVIIIGTAHHYGFSGVSVYSQGVFRTPLGDLEVDAEFTKRMLDRDSEIIFEPVAFEKEHSVEVQLPFLQRTLSGFKIVPIVTGDCSLLTCKKLARILKEAMAGRSDILVVVSTDMYHGYDNQQAEATDALTLSCLKNMDSEGLYYGVREGRFSLCGAFGVVSALFLAKELGYSEVKVLHYTNSGRVTGRQTKGIWCVGYSSCVIDAGKFADQDRIRGSGKNEVLQRKEGETVMLDKNQKRRLLEIARSSIQAYLKTGKKPEISEADPLLLSKAGAFVTLHESGDLRGCIGELYARQPLYLTIRDMAIEAAVGDPRFNSLKSQDLSKIEIEISVLSGLEKIDSIDKIQLGVHGVLVRRGFNSGVFLPQVATETGWSKEEFLSYLCSHKAGLKDDAWKDKATELYIFTAEVFSEKDVFSGE